jgi:hypothetical protein
MFMAIIRHDEKMAQSRHVILNGMMHRSGAGHATFQKP